jgi:hypothetical protein
MTHLILDGADHDTWQRHHSGILCTRTRRPRCACGTAATLQCDAPSKRRSGTCDKHLCTSCATEVRPDRHLCQGHRDLAPMLVSGASGVGEETEHAPVQAGLF